jgi:thioredoxin 1
MFEINESNFESSIKNSSAIVEFFTDWCSVCKTMEPSLMNLHQSYGKKIKFLKINAGKNANLAQKFSVMSVPTFLFVKNGRIIEQTVGFIPPGQLKLKVEALG